MYLIKEVETIDELKKVFEKCQEMKKSFHIWDENYPIFDNYLDTFNNGFVCVCFFENQIVGSICIDFNLEFAFLDISKAASISRFMVLPEYQRMGIGFSLFNYSEKTLKDKGFENIVFLVHFNNKKAMEMYEKWGCVNLGRFNTPWVNNITEYYYLYKKSL